MNRLFTGLIIVLFLLVSYTPLFAGEIQEKCPVMGGKINKEIYADYEGKRVYFCCAACVDAFKKSPDKYLQALEEQGVEPADVPATE